MGLRACACEGILREKNRPLSKTYLLKKRWRRPSAMAGSDKIWHYEQVKIKDSEYAKKCGIGGDCYFYVSKGQIKISQLDNKTSLDLAISRIRTWGASSTTFFLELGSRSPAGEGRLEMTHKNPNDLRLMVRETTSTRRPPGSSSSGSSRPPRAPQDAVEVEQMKTTTTTSRQKAEPQTTSLRSLKKRLMKMSMRRIMVRCVFSTKITTTMEESTEKAK